MARGCLRFSDIASKLCKKDARRLNGETEWWGKPLLNIWQLNTINYPKSGWGYASHAVCFWSTANGIGTWLRRFSLPSATAQSSLDDGDRNKLEHSKWIETLYLRKNLINAQFGSFLNCFFHMIPNERNCTTIGNFARFEAKIKSAFSRETRWAREPKSNMAHSTPFLKILRWGQLCSARNRRKKFSETSCALMVSGATIHHSMLCQLHLHHSSRYFC